MKLYHYIAKGNTALTEGILSLSQNPNADLRYYYKRSGQTTHSGIVRWMESCFKGRSRGIRAFSEPIKWTEHSLSLKGFVESADMFAIDVDALNQDALLEAVYVSPSVLDLPHVQDDFGCDEVLQKLNSVAEINFSPIDWSICNDQKGWRFSFVRYYLLIVKGGVIPPEYIDRID